MNTVKTKFLNSKTIKNYKSFYAIFVDSDLVLVQVCAKMTPRHFADILTKIKFTNWTTTHPCIKSEILAR